MVPLDHPVLSVALDAVSKVDSESALCGLLTLFTKCKGGLQEGPRLENMAWRLWNRGRSSAFLPPPHNCSSPEPLASPTSSYASSSSQEDSDSASDEECCYPDQATTAQEVVTTSQIPSPLSPAPLPQGTSLRAPQRQQSAPKRHKTPERSPSAHSNTSHRSYGRRPSLASRRGHSNTSVGKIMADLLPDKLDVHAEKKSPTSVCENYRWRESASALQLSASDQNVPAVVVQDLPEARQTMTPPPTTATEAVGTSTFPTVVIQNPTPHQTPPMTPSSQPPSPQNLPVQRDSLLVPSRAPLNCMTPPPSTPDSPSPLSRGVSTRNVPGIAEGAAGAAQGACGGIKNDDAHAGNASGVQSYAQPGSSSASVAPSAALTSSAANEPSESRDRKFYISRYSGSPDGDSQSGSSPRSTSISASVTTNMVTNGGEPASVASVVSYAKSTKSQSSNGSESRSGGSGGGLKMRSRKGKGVAPLRTAASRAATHLTAIAKDDIPGGTMLRSKVGGRVGVAAAAATAQMVQQNNARLAAVGQRGALVQAGAPALQRPALGKRTDSKARGGNRSTSRGRRTSDSSQQGRLAMMQPARVPVAGPSNIAAAARKAVPPVSKVAGPSNPAKAARIEVTESDWEYTTEEDEWTEDEDDEGDDVDPEEEAEVAAAAAVAKQREKELKDKVQLEEAAREAQRRRDFFTKVPRQSYTNLNRTNSGLLSAIFHPPPEIFPPNHPYRRSLSTHDILAQPPRTFQPIHGASQSKGSVAQPIAAPVNAEIHAAVVPQARAPQCSPNKSKRSPLRLKGRQEDAEMEDESGDEDDSNKLHISESLAQQRLAALQQKSSSRKASVPQPQPPQQVPSGIAQLQQRNAQPGPSAVEASGPSQLTHVTTAPLPISMYPYNLPPPQAPTTPRTTRRNFLAHELSESLRRNMLWERQISRQRPLRRTSAAAGNGVPNGSNGAVRHPLAQANGPPGQVQQQQQAGEAQAPEPVMDAAAIAAARLEERRKAAIARNKSWAGDYHAAGW